MSSNGFANTMDDVARDFVSFLAGFYKIHPELDKNGSQGRNASDRHCLDSCLFSWNERFVGTAGVVTDIKAMQTCIRLKPLQ